MNFKKIKNILFLSSVILSVNAEETKNKKDDLEEKNMTPKIAYVNIDKIISLNPSTIGDAADEWRDLFNNIQDTIDPVDKELTDLEKKFQKGRSEFETLQKSGLTSKEALGKKYEEVGRIEMQLRQKYQEREQLGQSELAKAQTKFGPKLERVIEDVRKSGGWDLILRGEIVLSANKDFDLTADVTKKLNKQYDEAKKSKEKEKAKAAPAPKAPAKK